MSVSISATGLKLMDDNKVKLGRFAVAAKAAILVAVVIGFYMVITMAYSGNGEGNISRGERTLWNNAAQEVLTMVDFGHYEASEAARGLSKLGLLHPDAKVTSLVLVGLVLVVGCYMLRFRFARWPLHPLFFVVLGTNISRFAWISFLLGWAFKALLVKVGGGRMYRSAKPLFIGFIIGEFMMVALMLVVGLIYYLNTGEAPVSFWTM